MINKKASGAVGLIETLIGLMITIFLIAYLINNGTISFMKTNACEGTTISACMSIEKCMSGTKSIIRDKSEDCDNGEVCCIIKSKDIVVKSKKETSSNKDNNSKNNIINNSNPKNGLARFVVEVNKKAIPDTGTILNQNQDYEFRIYASGEHTNLCRSRILYAEDSKPDNKLRTIKVTDLFNCKTGTSFHFTPTAENAQYQPIQMDFVTFAEDYNGEAPKSDKEGTNSWKYFLQINTTSTNKKTNKKTNKENVNCIDLKKEDCQKEGNNCFIMSRVLWFDQCKSCEEIKYFTQYNNQKACNENPCGLTIQGLGSAWTPYSNGGSCHICTKTSKENNCDEYKDKITCEDNPCDYGLKSCTWISGICKEVN